jgi:hypothetical protein
MCWGGPRAQQPFSTLIVRDYTLILYIIMFIIYYLHKHTLMYFEIYVYIHIITSIDCKTSYNRCLSDLGLKQIIQR